MEEKWESCKGKVEQLEDWREGKQRFKKKMLISIGLVLGQGIL